MAGPEPPQAVPSVTMSAQVRRPLPHSRPRPYPEVGGVRRSAVLQSLPWHQVVLHSPSGLLWPSMWATSRPSGTTMS
eukprot:451712-Pyramimonas_sp.AAC.1